MDPFTIRPIGVVSATRAEAVDDDWDAVRSRIVLDPGVVDPDATLGLELFSHLEVVFVFDRVDESAVCRGARHPRGNTAWPLVGILDVKPHMSGFDPRGPVREPAWATELMSGYW